MDPVPVGHGASIRRPDQKADSVMVLLKSSLAAISLLTLFSSMAWAEDGVQDPVAYCKSIGTNDTVRPIPSSLHTKGDALFNLKPHASSMLQWRCMDHAVWICSPGANLPCGKADVTLGTPGPITEWCQGHPDTDFVPMYVIGHNSPFTWSCKGKEPLRSPHEAKLDSRGFFKSYWKQLPAQ
ncbi:putative secreted protein [Granulibacter bethesdensis]|uniref:Secreted protein n=2 Tax=Granulibacter bethesdensis TaxID=364410 RepID=A0AAN0VFP8_9PROT|nr:putative secreted protein [Granulibacter bethesdensis]APH59465.1 putative secreted protein [Granulibacter bethesdensis]